MKLQAWRFTKDDGHNNPGMRVFVLQPIGFSRTTNAIGEAEVEANARLAAAAPAMRQRLEFAKRLLLQGDADGALREVEMGIAGHFDPS